MENNPEPKSVELDSEEISALNSIDSESEKGGLDEYSERRHSISRQVQNSIKFNRGPRFRTGSNRLAAEEEYEKRRRSTEQEPERVGSRSRGLEIEQKYGRLNPKDGNIPKREGYSCKQSSVRPNFENKYQRSRPGVNSHLNQAHT